MKDFITQLLRNPFAVHLLFMVAASCIILYGTLKWLDHYTYHNEAVVVPDVKGLSLEDAAVFFHKNHLRYNVVDSVFSKDVPPGAIVEIVPQAGSKVKERRILFVTINALTSQMAMIPEVEDLSFRQAYALLQSVGFKSVEVKYVPGDYKDLAIRVELNDRMLNPGERITLNAPLALIVSNGLTEWPADSLNPGTSPVESPNPVESLNSEEERWF
jgi:hypothetical protein